MCGTPVIDVALLKRITSYNSSMPDGEKHPVAALFWEVMEGLPNEDRAQVMAFAWGRRRMPPQVHRPRAACPPPPCCRQRIPGDLRPPSLPPALPPSLPPSLFLFLFLPPSLNAGGPAMGSLPSRTAPSAAIPAPSAPCMRRSPPRTPRTQHSQ